MPKCRCCHLEIVKENKESWVMPATNWYYHKDCYENWKAKKDDVFATAEEDEWKGLLWDYITRDIKLPGANYAKFENQWMNFLHRDKKVMTAKGLFFACRYFYEVVKGDTKAAEGGIGILPYVYDDSCAYWTNRNTRTAEIINKLDEQKVQQVQREKVVIAQRPKKQERKQISLADVMAMEED